MSPAEKERHDVETISGAVLMIFGWALAMAFAVSLVKDAADSWVSVILLVVSCVAELLGTITIWGVHDD
jgi:hypothetical protein